MFGAQYSVVDDFLGEDTEPEFTRQGYKPRVLSPLDYATELLVEVLNRARLLEYIIVDLGPSAVSSGMITSVLEGLGETMFRDFNEARARAFRAGLIDGDGIVDQFIRPVGCPAHELVDAKKLHRIIPGPGEAPRAASPERLAELEAKEKRLAELEAAHPTEEPAST